LTYKMWVNAQRDGCHAEHRWRPFFNAANVADAHYQSAVQYNAAKTRNPLTLAGLLQTRQQIAAASGPKFPILLGHVQEILLFNNFFPVVDVCLICEDMARQSCAMVRRWRFCVILASCIFSEPRAAHYRSAL